MFRRENIRCCSARFQVLRLWTCANISRFIRRKSSRRWRIGTGLAATAKIFPPEHCHAKDFHRNKAAQFRQPEPGYGPVVSSRTLNPSSKANEKSRLTAGWRGKRLVTHKPQAMRYSRSRSSSAIKASWRSFRGRQCRGESVLTDDGRAIHECACRTSGMIIVRCLRSKVSPLCWKGCRRFLGRPSMRKIRHQGAPPPALVARRAGPSHTNALGARGRCARQFENAAASNRRTLSRAAVEVVGQHVSMPGTSELRMTDASSLCGLASQPRARRRMFPIHGGK